MINFADRLVKSIHEKGSAVVVGLDPRPNLLPEEIIKTSLRGRNPAPKTLAKAYSLFGKGIIDAVFRHAVAVKIQIAFYEMLGPEGLRSFIDAQRFAKERGLIVIGDIKRGDVGSTAEAYARGYLGKVLFGKNALFSQFLDAVTVNPYFGFDGIEPFLTEAEKEGKGLFFLIKTSNPSSKEIQNFPDQKCPLYERVARLVDSWGKPYRGEGGYSLAGGVVGATYPNEAKRIRKILMHSFLLVPGYGAQGGKKECLIHFFNTDGLGALIVSSRDIIFSFRKDGRGFTKNWQDDIEKAAKEMNDAVNQALRSKREGGR